MTREDLAEIIVEYMEKIEFSITLIEKEIVFNEDIVSVMKKHNKSAYEFEKTINRLEIKLEIMKNAKDELNELLENHNIEFKDVKELLKGE